MSQHEEDGALVCKRCGATFDVHDAVSSCPGDDDLLACPSQPPRSDFDAVGDFHAKFGLPCVPSATSRHPDHPVPHLIPSNVATFRWGFLMEEMTELLQAMNRDDLPEIADALVDLVYVALGTAHMYGLPWPELFEEVQRANMTKERAKPDASNSKRRSALDVIKPPGWTPPRIEQILERFGWRLL